MSIFNRLRKRKWMIRLLFRSNFKEKRNLLRGFLRRKQYHPSKKVEADITKLIHCGLCPNMCRFDCPAVQASKKDTHSPSQKARIAYYIEMDRLEKTEENIMPLFEGCVHCSGCQIWCPFDFAVGDLLEGVARDLFKSNSLPQPLTDFSNRIRENDGLYKIDKYAAASKTLADLTEGDIYYYPGCVTMGNNSKVISGIKEIAVEADISLKTDTEKRVCCGAPSIYLGDIEKAKDLAQKNVKQIKDAKVKAIICECPECVHALKNQYPTLGYKLNIPIYHISEWILSLIDCGKINLKDGDELDKYQEYFPISYHDPCVLSRKLGIIEEPYKILRTMFPENFKETTYSKELTHCCGFGGLANIVNHSIANTMSANRLAEFQKEDVKTIVTSCPTCWYSFMKNNPDMQFEIKDLVELVTELMIRKK